MCLAPALSMNAMPPKPRARERQTQHDHKARAGRDSGVPERGGRPCHPATSPLPRRPRRPRHRYRCRAYPGVHRAGAHHRRYPPPRRAAGPRWANVGLREIHQASGLDRSSIPFPPAPKRRDTPDLSSTRTRRATSSSDKKPITSSTAKTSSSLSAPSISRRSSSRCTSSPVSPTKSSRRPLVGQRRATRNTSGIRAGPIPAFRSRQRPSGGIRRTHQHRQHHRHHHVETRPPQRASADGASAAMPRALGRQTPHDRKAERPAGAGPLTKTNQ